MDKTYVTGGLTKRELFAAMAMQSLVAEPEKFSIENDADMAMRSVKMADALIAAAPDLLEALREYRKAYDAAWSALNSDARTKVALAVLKAGAMFHDDHAAAAIARATGATP